MEQVYTVIDIETTGGNSRNSKITEIAIIVFDGKKIIDEFETLLNPECKIPFYISKLTGITNEMVQEAPKFYEVAKKIVELTENRIFVAHNVFFDFNFIKKEFKELGYSFNREKLCTVKLSRKFIPGHKSYSLGNICKDLKIQIENRHRAMGDAKATVQLLKHILSKESKPEIIIKEKQKLTLPSQLNEKSINTLPEKGGIYYFLDENFKVIYIGKSKNIYKRVRSHFNTKLKNHRDLTIRAKISHIDFLEIPDPYLTSILEISEIKRNRPLLNKQYNRTRFRYGIILEKNSKTRSVYEIKVSTLIHEIPLALRYRSRKSCEAEIERIHKFLFPIENASKEQLINIFSKDEYNKKLETYFNRFNIKETLEKTINADKSSITIKIDDFCLKHIIINNKKFNIVADPEVMRSLHLFLDNTQMLTFFNII